MNRKKIDEAVRRKLTELASDISIKKNGRAARNVAYALCSIAKSDIGRQSCIDAGAPLELVTLSGEKSVKENGDAAQWVARALGKIAESDAGIQSCIDAGAPLALTELAKEKAVKENSEAARNVAAALGKIAQSDTGRQSCVDAGAPLALSDLICENAVRRNDEVFKDIVNACLAITGNPPESLAIVASELVSSLKSVRAKNDSRIILYAVEEITELTKSPACLKACIDAGVCLALSELVRSKVVIEDEQAAKSVRKALNQISSSDIGRQSCIDAGVPHSFLNWTSKKSSRENDLIWIQGDKISSTGSVLAILAQNGYTREAHQIISLSRIASLIGRDSDGGLPELWDVMGKVRGKGGITRLMAICITRGSLSSQRARALIRDHNVDVKARDNQGRTALHHAVGSRNFDNDIFSNEKTSIPINTDLIRVLFEACPDLVKMKDGYSYLDDDDNLVDDGTFPLTYALENNAPYNIIKLLSDLYPDALNHFCDTKMNVPILSKLSPSSLIALGKEKAVKENGKAAGSIAEAIIQISVTDAGKQALIDAGAPLTLTELSYEKAVKENGDAARAVAEALFHISGVDACIQACIDAGVSPSSIIWASKKSSRENDLIWMHGLGPGSRGSVLVILAQNGYTREAHQIISLSRTASLIGRDSDGGLPELWDIMGKVRGEEGITRLMAVCITRGSLSSQRALSLIRDHNVDVKARDDQGRTALHYALLDKNPFNTELIRILIEAYPEAVNILDKVQHQHTFYNNDYDEYDHREETKTWTTSMFPLEYAIKAKAPMEVIKVLINPHPIELRQLLFLACQENFSSDIIHTFIKDFPKYPHISYIMSKRSTFPASLINYLIDTNPDLVKEKDRHGKLLIHWACEWSAPYEFIKRLVDIYPEGLKETDNNNNLPIATCCQRLHRNQPIEIQIFNLLVNSYPDGIEFINFQWLSLSTLRVLINEKIVKDNPEVIMKIASAVEGKYHNSSDQMSLLLALIQEKIIKGNVNAARSVVQALENLTKRDTGQQACIDAVGALTAMASELAVMNIIDAVDSVIYAFKNISSSPVGLQACIDARSILVLTALAREEVVKENGKAVYCLADAFKNIASSPVGLQACIDAGVCLALSELVRSKVMIENEKAAKSVRKALWNISSSDIGRQSCIDAGVPHSFLNWTSKKSSRENDLIWIQGDKISSTGSVLAILAQNGYTREAHQIIS
jgi:ankyrin repeat protein